MYCKYCGAQLEENCSICPTCGENTGDFSSTQKASPAPAGKRRRWVLLVAACVAALAAAIAVWYAVNGGRLPRKNDVMVKDSYTVSDEKAVAKADVVVATFGDRQLTNGQLQAYYWMQFVDFVNYYADYLGTYIALDITKPLDEQTVDESGTTWQQYLLEGAVQTWHRYQALCMAAKEDGYQLDESYQASLDEERVKLLSPESDAEGAYALEMLRQQMGPGCAVEDYLQFLEDYCYGLQYFADYFDKMQPTDEEVITYFKEHEDEFKEMGVLMDDSVLVDIRHILIAPKGEEDENGNIIYTDSDWEVCRDDAQAVLDQWLAGEKTPESFAALAQEKSEDTTSNSSGGLYENVYDGYFGAGMYELNAWNMDKDRKTGDYGLVRTNYGYHVMFFEGSHLKWKQYALSSLKTELGNQFTKDLMARYPLEVNYRKIALGLADYSK